MKPQNKKKLLDLLLKQKGIKQTKYYADFFGVTKRTIYNYLNDLQEELNKKGIYIKKLPSKGIEVINKSENVLLEEDVEDYSVLARISELINRLILKEEKINLKNFCDEFYVSESTIRKDVNFLKNILKNFKEIDFLFIKNYIIFKSKNVETSINVLVCLIEGVCEEFCVEQERFLRLVFDNDTVEEVFFVVEQYISTFELNVAKHYITNVCLFLICLTSFLTQEKHISDKKHFLDVDKLKNMDSTILSQHFLKQIKTKINISYNDDDINFVSLYLKVNKFSLLGFEKINEDDLVVYKRILDKLSKILNVDFKKEEKLTKNFLVHLNAMVYRLRNKITINNQMLENIKVEFGPLFNLLWVLLETEDSILRIKISEQELGFLLIHVQNIIQKQKKTKNILLVCPQGDVNSNLILNQLRQILPSFNFIETISLNRLKKVSLESIDFIISTIPLKNINKPFIIINPILTNNDVSNIVHFYRNVVEKEKNKNIKILKNFIDEKYIFEKNSFKTKTEIIDFVCKKLLEDDVIDVSYKESIINRESFGSTDNVFGFALPHGDLKFVKETKIVFVILKKPIKWKRYLVRFVIFLNINKKDLLDLKDLLDELFYFMKKDEFKKQINKEKVLELLEKGFYD